MSLSFSISSTRLHVLGAVCIAFLCSQSIRDDVLLFTRPIWIGVITYVFIQSIRSADIVHLLSAFGITITDSANNGRRTRSSNMRSDSNKVHAGCQSKHAGDSQNASKSRVTECGKDVDKPAQIAAQDSIIEKLKTEVGEKRACIIKLQTNLDQCRTENTRLQTEYIRSHEMVSDMAALNASILQENSTRTAEITALQRRNAELATELDALRDESDEICIENKEQHNLILAMLPELNRQNELIGELEDKFRRLFLKHAKLQVVVRQLTDDQAILDEIDSDNQQYVSENCRISEEVSDSINRYNDKLSAYKKEELEIIDFNQHCQVHTPADSVE